jgi:hypothetical protein
MYVFMVVVVAVGSLVAPTADVSKPAHNSSHCITFLDCDTNLEPIHSPHNLYTNLHHR